MSSVLTTTSVGCWDWTHFSFRVNPKSLRQDTVSDSSFSDVPISQHTWLQWQRRIDSLRRADQTFQNMLFLEAWAIAQTLDESIPGFWAAYMRNRHDITHQYIETHKVRHLQRRLLKEDLLPAAKLGIEPIPSQPELPSYALSIPRRISAALTVFPHALSTPEVEVLPTSDDTNVYGLLLLNINCQSTRHFWPAIADRDQPTVTTQITDVMTIQPNQGLVCGLGFQVRGISSPVRVVMADTLPSYLQTHIKADWLADIPALPRALKAIATTEAAILIKNVGDRPCWLTAGEPLCGLEFYWSPVQDIMQ